MDSECDIAHFEASSNLFLIYNHDSPRHLAKMDIRFPVRWRQQWRSLTIYIFVAIFVPLALFIGIDQISGGQQRGRHITLLEIVIAILALAVFSCVVSLIIALFMRLASVRVTEDFLEGRNYWGLKKRIPLTDLTTLSRFNSSGINAIVASSSRHGKIYIPIHTENLSDLIDMLGTYLPKQTNGSVR